MHPQNKTNFAPHVHLLLNYLVLLWLSKHDITMFHRALFNMLAIK